MAPIAAQTQFNKHMEMLDDQDKLDEYHNSKCASCSCAACCLIPPESVTIALDALFIIDIKINRDTQKYKVKDEVKDRFAAAKKEYERLHQESQSLSSRVQAVLANSKAVELEMSTQKKGKGGKKGSGAKSDTGSKKSKKSDKKGKKDKKKKKDK